MATFMLIDDNVVDIQPGDSVTFQLTSTTSGQVPVTIPYEVFGTNNQFTLEIPTNPSATRVSMTSIPSGEYQVTWDTDDGTDAQAKRHNGNVRVGNSS